MTRQIALTAVVVVAMACSKPVSDPKGPAVATGKLDMGRA